MTKFRPIPSTGKMPAVAVFDLDRTLIAADTTIFWTDWLFERGVIRDARYRDVNQTMLLAYHRGEMDYSEYLRGIIPFFNHLSRDERLGLTEEFIETRIAPLVFPEGLARVQEARALGMDTLIISASWSFLARPIGLHLFGIDKSYAVDIAEDVCGRLIPEIRGTAPFREGKIAKLHHALSALGRSTEETVFFTDSRNDLPLALTAGDCETVNPDPALRQAAVNNHWIVNHWDLSFNK